MKNSQIFGLRPVIEAIEAGRTIDKLFIQKGLSGTLFATLLKLVERHQLSHSFVPVEKLNRLTHGNHQGVVAQLSPVEFVPLEELVRSTIESGKVPLLLILDHLSDVRNVGAIIRTAIVMGAEDVGISKGVLRVLDERAKLPLQGETASLNVSVACGAFLYEVVRQRIETSD